MTAADPARTSPSGYDLTPLSPERIEALAASLTEDEARVILRKGTEPAFCGNLTDNKKEGVYICRLCSLPLFSSSAKFDSGSGWPSFFQPFDEAHVATELDKSIPFMPREEILCARCGAHLGHVFDDGPPPTGQRHCVNSVSLAFVEAGDPLPDLPAAPSSSTQTAYFAGGCFWGVEDRLQQVPGVIDAVSGYQGGHVVNPTYKQVCYTDTGHAETVRVTFDPSQVTYRRLLEAFFAIHDPTQLNRQGPDYGPQYRSAVFAANEEQLREAKAYIDELAGADRFKGRKIVTQVQMAGPFYEAEEYHQDYHLKHGGSCPLPEF